MTTLIVYISGIILTTCHSSSINLHRANCHSTNFTQSERKGNFGFESVFACHNFCDSKGLHKTNCLFSMLLKLITAIYFNYRGNDKKGVKVKVITVCVPSMMKLGSTVEIVGRGFVISYIAICIITVYLAITVSRS